MYAKSLLYVAIGDSLTKGVGAFFSPGFVIRYANMTEKALGERVVVKKYAKNGATTLDILKAIDARGIERLIKQANIITITAGGNDLIDAEEIFMENHDYSVLMSSLQAAQNNISAIIQRILEIKENDLGHTVIRIVNLYNPNPYRYEASQWINQYNYYLYQLQNKNIRVADVFSPFYGRAKELLFFDYIHPNSKGYQVIANRLFMLGYQPLVVDRNMLYR